MIWPATVNRELALLKRMCNKAIEYGYLKTNPLKSVKFLKELSGRHALPLARRNGGVDRRVSTASQAHCHGSDPYRDAQIRDFRAQVARYRFFDEAHYGAWRIRPQQA